MQYINLKFSTRRGSRKTACMLFSILCLLVGGNQASANAATTKVDACTLLSAASVAKYSHKLGAGHNSNAPHPANVSSCVWSDAHHLPGLMLTLAPADPSGVVKGLAQGFAHMGYRIVPISGLGDEAAVAIQMANPNLHIATGVAELVVRVGKHQLVFSPLRPAITGIKTSAFARLKQLAAVAIANLKNH